MFTSYDTKYIFVQRLHTVKVCLSAEAAHLKCNTFGLQLNCFAFSSQPSH